jgi:hypothetical protein
MKEASRALVEVALAVVATLGIACGPQPTARQDPDAGAAAPVTTPFDGQPVAGTVKRIVSRKEVPLGGHYLDARPGDWLLENEGSIAVVSAEKGRVIAFGERGGHNGLVYLHPTAYIAFDTVPTFPPRIEVLHGHILHIVARVQTRPLELHVWMNIGDARLTVASQLHNVGDERELAVTLGERAAWANTPTWLAGHGELLAGGSYGGAFVGRTGPGIAYALCNHDGRVNVKSTRPSADGFHRTHKIGRDRVSIEPNERSPIRRVTLTHAASSVGAAALKLPCAGDREFIELPKDAAAYGIETAYCETKAAQLARVRRRTEALGPGEELEGDEKLRQAGDPYVHYAQATNIAIPTECARLRLIRRGHEPGAWIDPRRDDEQGWKHDERLPKAGKLRWRIRDKNEDAPLPAKLIVRGRKKTETPNWGEDPEGGAARHFIYTHADGEIAIPPGDYEVSAYRGFEYTRHVEKIVVKTDAAVTIEAKLERVVDTGGWISADLHVHAMPSWDAPATLNERVLSLAGVGVEVGVATDHNAVTDYGPAITSLGLASHVASLVGDEVTTEETMLGHFNVFPLEPGSEPIAHEHVHPHDLFEVARRRANGGVIQVNHPRMGDIGYFELLHMDRGDVPGWAGRATLGDMSFDAIEVFSGDHFADIDEVRWVLDDWFALLEAGLRHTATGNSDSHKVAYQDAGMPRNWVAIDRDTPATFDLSTFITAIRQAKVVVSSGPFVRFTTETNGLAHGIGDTIDPGARDFAVRVEAPPWIDVSTVELIRRGHVIKRWKVTGDETTRLDVKHRVEVTSGDWLLVLVSGDKSMRNTYRKNAKPFAFTNPIWVR